MRSILSTKRLRLGVLAVFAAAGAAAFGALGYAAPSETAAQAQYAPTNTAPPTISDTTPQTGQTLTAGAGTWTGDQPIVFAFRWLRCNAGGQNCVEIPNAVQQSYVVQNADLDRTLRVRVTASNASGSNSADSAATSRVTPGAAPGTTIPITAVSLPNRLVVSQVRFDPNPVRSRTAPIRVRVRVLDTRGFVISGAVVFVRSTPLVTRTPGEVTTGNDGWAEVRLVPRFNFNLVFRRGYSLQIFVRARKPGENVLAGVTTRRLVQVGISPS